MGYFHRFLIFGLLAELLTIEKSKNISKIQFYFRATPPVFAFFLKTTLARKLPFASLIFPKNSGGNKLVQIFIKYDA